MITSQAGWKWSDVIHDLGIRFSDIAHQDMVIKAERISDLYRAKKEGIIAFVGSLESSTMIENELAVGVPAEFEVTTIAGDKAGLLVIGNSSFENAEAIETLEYFETSNNTWRPLVGDFGPLTWIPSL